MYFFVRLWLCSVSLIRALMHTIPKWLQTIEWIANNLFYALLWKKVYNAEAVNALCLNKYTHNLAVYDSAANFCSKTELLCIKIVLKLNFYKNCSKTLFLPKSLFFIIWLFYKRFVVLDMYQKNKDVFKCFNYIDSNSFVQF
jgi:hypothetical protein